MLNSNGTLDINPDGNNGTTIFARQSPLTTNIWYHLVVSQSRSLLALLKVVFVVEPEPKLTPSR